MTTTNLQVRRATVEDLQRLAPLWQQEHLSGSDLATERIPLACSRSGGEEAGWFHRRYAPMALFATKGRIRARGLTRQGVRLVQGIGKGDDQPIIPPSQGHESDRGGGCVRGFFYGRRLGVLLFQTPEKTAWTVKERRVGLWPARRSRIV